MMKRPVNSMGLSSRPSDKRLQGEAIPGFRTLVLGLKLHAAEFVSLMLGPSSGIRSTFISSEATFSALLCIFSAVLRAIEPHAYQERLSVSGVTRAWVLPSSSVSTLLLDARALTFASSPGHGKRYTSSTASCFRSISTAKKGSVVTSRNSKRRLVQSDTWLCRRLRLTIGGHSN